MMRVLKRIVQHEVPKGGSPDSYLNDRIEDREFFGDAADGLERYAALLAGELGLSEVFHTLHGAHARSYPARLPMLTLDRIYTRGLRVTQAQVHHGAPWAQLSDHLPLSATLLPE